MKKYITEAPQSVDASKYKDINFKQIGHGNPLSDKINPSLLADVDKAAKIAGTKASVTTAVSGHKKGTRHESGLAVDIAMFDGVGYSSLEDAKKKGIYDKIEKFVKALEGMGYKINSESGNDKAVLWFGFPNHHHHVHISRKSDDGESSSTTQTSTTSDATSGDTTSGKKEMSNFDMMGGNQLMGFLDTMFPTKKKEEEKSAVNEELSRIHEIMKKLL